MQIGDRKKYVIQPMNHHMNQIPAQRSCMNSKEFAYNALDDIFGQFLQSYSPHHIIGRQNEVHNDELVLGN